MKTNNYVHVSDKIIPKDQNLAKLNLNEHKPKSPNYRTSSRKIAVHFEVNASAPLERWRFVKYCQEMSEDRVKFLKGGDVVRLKHSEYGGFLSNDMNIFTKEGFNECYVSVCTGPEDLENVSSASLFEIEIDGDDSRGKTLRWVKDHDDSQGSILFIKYLNYFSDNFSKNQISPFFDRQIFSYGQFGYRKNNRSSRHK